jgi:hypothetical protein
MAKPHRFTTKQVIGALQDAKGMVSIAAQRLQCTPDTVQNYCKKFPTVAQAKENARTEMLDQAEMRLLKAIERDEAWAIAFCLKTIGRSRGYAERVDLHISVQAVAQKVADEFGLSVQEVLQEARLLLMEVDGDAP